MIFRILGGKDDPAIYKNDGGRLLVDCGKCECAPDIGTLECMRCVSRIITETGMPDRIVLRSGHDTEYSGDVVELMVSMSKIDGLANAVMQERKRRSRCSSCSRSASKLLSSAWVNFPEVDMGPVRSELNSFNPGNKGCEACIMQTYRSSEQLEHALEELKRECARYAFNLIGV